MEKKKKSIKDEWRTIKESMKWEDIDKNTKSESIIQENTDFKSRRLREQTGLGTLLVLTENDDIYKEITKKPQKLQHSSHRKCGTQHTLK